MYKPTAILKSALLVWQNDVGELVKLGLPLEFSVGSDWNKSNVGIER